MTTGLAAERTQLSSFEQRRGSLENFEFTWPGSDVSVQLDEIVLITWTQAIDSDEIGALWIYLVDKVEESRVMIGRKYAEPEQLHLFWGPARAFGSSRLIHRTGNITGSELIWTVPSDIEFFVTGKSYWFELEVFPKHRVAVSERFKLAKSSSQSWRTSTASSVVIFDGTTSTQIITRTMVNSESSPQTAVPTSGDDESSGISESDYLEASNPDIQTLSPGATVGIATGALLGITLLVLIGVLVYRRKRSYKEYHNKQGGQDAVVVSVPAQHSGMNMPEMEAFGPKARIGDNAGVCGHTAACRDFHEME